MHVVEMRHGSFRTGPETALVGAAPAGEGRTSHPGGLGSPIGGHYDPSARSSLDWDWRECLVPGNADPGTEIAAHGAPRGDAPFRKKGARAAKRDIDTAPFGAPSPPPFFERTTNLAKPAARCGPQPKRNSSRAQQHAPRDRRSIAR